MPVYNERATLRQIVSRVLAVPLEIELLCVDDGSRDGSREILEELGKLHPQLRVLLQPPKLSESCPPQRDRFTETSFLVQDADLEYDPAEYPNLLGPLIEGKPMGLWLSVHGRYPHRVYFWHSVGNWILTSYPIS